MKEFFHTWWLGYYSPSRWVECLCGRPAPLWGVAAQGLRALLDAALLYLPLALMGRQPTSPSWLTFLSTEHYYANEVWLAPVFLMLQWLLMAVFLHVLLRLLGKQSDIDQILNITGMAALVIGAFLLLWDWSWVLLGIHNPIALGIFHLAADAWAIALTVLAMKKIMGIPARLGVMLSILGLFIAVPLAMIFMRAPL